MRPTRMMGFFSPCSSTRLICSRILSFLAMVSDSQSANASAQSPPCSRNASPRGAAALALAALRGQNAPLFQRDSMHRVLVLGAGKIGALICGLLAESGSYKVQLGDIDGAAAEAVVRAHETRNILAFALDATDT